MRSGFLLTAVLLAAPPPGPPPPPAAPRVTILLSQESPAYRAAADGFRAELLGDGVQVEVEVRAVGVADPEQTRQDRAHPPDLILALGSSAAAAAGAQFAAVPVVAVVLRRAEFARLGLATGVYLEFPVELELQWLRRVLPKARRIGVVYNPAENAGVIEHARTVAAGLGLELVPRKVDSRERLPDALASLANDAQVLWGIADTLVLTPETARSFLLFQFRQQIPFAGLSDAWARAGALYALDRDWTDLGRQCAELAEQVLRGKAPGSLDPVPPRRATLSLNRNTAQTLRLELSPEALRVAKEAGQVNPGRSFALESLTARFVSLTTIAVLAPVVGSIVIMALRGPGRPGHVWPSRAASCSPCWPRTASSRSTPTTGWRSRASPPG